MNKKLSHFLNTVAPRKFVCVDVGARGGLGYPWFGLKEITEGVCFEADQEEQERLRTLTGETVLPYALAERCGEYNLYLTSNRANSSLLPPNHNFFNLYPESERMNIDEVVQCQCVTIDSLYEKGILERCDFIKLDTQGSELAILRGGKQFLSDHALGMEVEVEFRQLYKNQPLFRDVDKYVSEELNMELVDLRHSYWKYSEGFGTGQRRGSIIFANALYFRSPDKIIELCKKEPCGKARYIMGLIMYLAYGYADFSLRLMALGRKEGILEEEAQTSLENAVRSYAGTFIYKVNKKFNGRIRSRIFLAASMLASIFDPRGGEWNTWGSHLGSRKKWNVFF